jgi:glyoxylase-like metal-dependent hydrolase (beta-lactamase superfamily II)
MKEIVKGIFVETEFDGVNVGAIQVEDDLFYIDSPSYPRDARRWATFLGSIHSRPARYLILTDSHGDRVLNSRWLNAPIVMHQNGAEQINEIKRRYPQDWLSSLSARNPASRRELSSSPVERVSMSFSMEMRIITDGLTIVLRHEPGPTPASSWVFIPERKILFAGDSIVYETHPMLAQMNSGQWMDSLQRLSALADEIDVIVPGRGPVCDAHAATAVLEYLVEIRAAVQEHIDAGKSEESLGDYAEDLLDSFPIGTLPREWTKEQIVRGLERVYQELIVEDYMESTVIDQT